MPATTGVPGEGAGTPEVTAEGPPSPVCRPGPGMRWRQVFPGEERQLSAVRRWLSSLLPACDARDDVVSVVTELGSNAIRHTASGRGGWFVVEITWYDHPGLVRLAVADAGAPGEPRMVDDPLAENGRGLMLVRGMSARTGVSGDHRGRVVWADIPWQGGLDTAVAPALDPYEAAIRTAEADLASRYEGVPIWFGRFTLQWWALVGTDTLLSASSPQELSTLVDEALLAWRAMRPVLVPVGPDGAPGVAAPLQFPGQRMATSRTAAAGVAAATANRRGATRLPGTLARQAS